MLICVLSAEYFASSNAVFVLESGVKVGRHISEWFGFCRYRCFFECVLQWKLENTI